MKKGLTFLIVLLVGVFVLSCQSAKNGREKSDEPAVVVEKTIHIGGMHCDMCVASIEKGVGELEGIESVTASLNDSTTIVKYDESKVEMDDIENAIVRRGYTIKKEGTN
jgi:Cu+-exporting ATPase